MLQDKHDNLERTNYSPTTITFHPFLELHSVCIGRLYDLLVGEMLRAEADQYRVANLQLPLDRSVPCSGVPAEHEVAVMPYSRQSQAQGVEYSMSTTLRAAGTKKHSYSPFQCN